MFTHRLWVVNSFTVVFRQVLNNASSHVAIHYVLWYNVSTILLWKQIIFAGVLLVIDVYLSCNFEVQHVPYSWNSFTLSARSEPNNGQHHSPFASHAALKVGIASVTEFRPTGNLLRGINTNNSYHYRTSFTKRCTAWLNQDNFNPNVSLLTIFRP